MRSILLCTSHLRMAEYVDVFMCAVRYHSGDLSAFGGTDNCALSRCAIAWRVVITFALPQTIGGSARGHAAVARDNASHRLAILSRAWLRLLGRCRCCDCDEDFTILQAVFAYEIAFVGDPTCFSCRNPPFYFFNRGGGVGPALSDDSDQGNGLGDDELVLW